MTEVVLCSPSHSDDMHALTVMHMHLLHVGTHAHATAPCTFDNCTHSGSPHNVLHSSSIYAAQFFPYQECNDWGEPERTPHRRVCCEFSIYLFISLYISCAMLIRMTCTDSHAHASAPCRPRNTCSCNCSMHIRQLYSLRLAPQCSAFV